jgi:hypothetical protein
MPLDVSLVNAEGELLDRVLKSPEQGFAHAPPAWARAEAAARVAGAGA